MPWGGLVGIMSNTGSERKRQIETIFLRIKVKETDMSESKQNNLKEYVGQLKEVTLLYCEDEPQLNEVTARQLSRFVRKVIVARDGGEGLELFRIHRHEIDMVITDISMPVMDGLEMTRAIKEIEPRIPVIVTTAYSSTDHLLEAIDIHVDKYVLKPLDLGRLIKAMAQSLTYHELRTLYRDPQTGLFTRHALLKDLEEASSSQRLILLTLKDFNAVSELYGDEIQEKTVDELSRKLLGYFGEEFTLYRIGLESFVLIDHKSDRPLETVRSMFRTFARRCRDRGIIIEGIPIHLILRVAVTYSEDGHTLYYLQQALHEANATHRNFIEYRPQSADTAHREKNIWWTLELSNAEKTQRFRPYFQPIVDTQTLQVYKYEALIRHVDADGVIQGATDFLTIAQKAKLYPLIIRIVLRKSLELIRRAKVRVAVNISYSDLIDENTSSFIDEILKSHPEEARLLEFEILESEKIDNYRLADAFIRQVKAHGCRVGIDDFGIGYSNFAMIESLRVDFIKIDGGLIQGIDRCEQQRLIVETIHSFCQKLGIKTIAERVCTPEEYSVIKAMGIDLIQGWYVSRELPQEEISGG